METVSFNHFMRQHPTGQQTRYCMKGKSCILLFRLCALHRKIFNRNDVWLDTDSDCDFKMHFFQIDSGLGIRAIAR